MNTSQLLAVDLVLSVLAAGGWITAVWLTVASTAGIPSGDPSSSAVPWFRSLDLALLLTGIAVAATAARYALLPALVAGSWWFASERTTINLPLTAIPAAWAAMAGVPFLLRRRNTGFKPAGRAGARSGPSREWAVLSLVAAAASSLASLVLALVLGPFPAPWTLAVLLFMVAGSVLLARLALFGRGPAMREGGTSRLGRRPTAAAAVAGLMACTVLGSGVFAWLGSRSADGAVISAAVGHHDSTNAATTMADTTPVTSLLGTSPADAVVRRYELTARVEHVTLPSGQTTEAWTFGSVPGPALEAHLGEVLEVELTNRDVAAGVTLHWHGYDVPNAMDGVAGATQDALMPGQSMTYRFTAAQSGTYWYHTHQDSAEGVRKGLYGTFVVHDPALPRADTDIVVAGHDLSGLGLLGSSDRRSPHAAAPGSSVRMRLINTDSLPQRYVVEGTPFKAVAVDGTEVNQPGDVSGKLVRLGAGGRVDIAFTMPGTLVTLRSDAAASAVVVVVPSGHDAPEASAGVPEKAPAGVFATTPVLDLLDYGKPMVGTRAGQPLPQATTITREEVLVLDRQFRFVDGVPRYAFTVNGAAYPLVPSIDVAEGDTVKVTVVNRTAEPHPMHPHGHHVQVLSRNGTAPGGSPLVLDTVDVLPGEVWELLLHADNPGIWMDHCHNLDHAAEGMMMLLKYQGVSSPFVHGGHAHNKPE
ncbi:Multicopper oxidase with three cupredoxin domains (includes cell division protein FtsP and spore coat protein CotA) [Arthrobacter sp. cf158]|uniref:multicopper oxidase family protein n=1 Tax=Arthrobacter sp. cf158 TaxID=1761744 RepID=UPI000899A86E|nr:multicopper oxidase family protein [Arthrobacter sp. cf158]SDW00421.1 Multicopper oxidase with three cupredoxin domains (includes cell division protein FtsP and spore coat protein CotA) [Arthrobacter sp. cf158]